MMMAQAEIEGRRTKNKVLWTNDDAADDDDDRDDDDGKLGSASHKRWIKMLGCLMSVR